MSGNGTSENLSLSTSTPSFSSEALIVTSQTFLSVLTAIVLPSRSLAVLIGPLLRHQQVGPGLLLVLARQHALG